MTKKEGYCKRGKRNNFSTVIQQDFDSMRNIGIEFFIKRGMMKKKEEILYESY